MQYRVERRSEVVEGTSKLAKRRRQRRQQRTRFKPQTDALYDELYQRYPQTFVRDPEKVHPLKIGISHDLRTETPRRVLHYALQRYTTRPAYLRALIARKPRVDLCGQAVGTVTDEEREAAKAHLSQWEKRRRPKAFRRQQVDEKPRPSHPQPRPADSASAQDSSPGTAAPRQGRPLPDTWQRLLSYLATADGPQRPVDIGVALGMNHPGSMLRRMRERGLVQQVTRGRYELASEPPDTQASLDACSD
jgi:sRNA-binding protein